MQQLRQLGITGAFVAVTTLFFVWGFISSNNDPLIVAMQAVFRLNYTEALMIQLVSFLANGLMSFPAAMLGIRLGPVRTILLALATMASGCLAVGLAVREDTYAGVLAALFILALGITILQVSANPLAAALGPARTSHFRLNLAQAFNSLGVVVGVNYGAAVMLGGQAMANGQDILTNQTERAVVLSAVDHAFAVMAAMLVLLATFFWTQRRRIQAATANQLPVGEPSVLGALRSRWALFGALAIGLYVGAEVSIGSIMIRFLHDRAIMGMPLELAGIYLANFYWGGALAGRIAGSILLTRVAAAPLLVVCGGMAMLLCLIAFMGTGPISGWAALGVGLFNSIMFPTIFSLTLERSGVSASATSGLLVLAISLGAVLPYLVGRLADMASLAAAFAVPACAYLVILCFALRAASVAQRQPG